MFRSTRHRTFPEETDIKIYCEMFNDDVAYVNHVYFVMKCFFNLFIVCT